MEEYLSKLLESLGDIDIRPCMERVDLNRDFEKLVLTKEQQNSMSLFVHQLPTITTSQAASNLYTIHIPDGVNGTLVSLKNGGYSTMIRDLDTGRFVGAASLYPALESYAMVTNAFAAMSMASGQFYLSQINDELKLIRMGIDSILEFLYGDKKAELLSEISFIKYAYQNFSSLMSHEAQRIATISGLQEARRIAMKNIEFYLHDLESLVNNLSQKDILQSADKALKINDSLELSVQLYGMSSVLEVYFAENYDSDYMQYIEAELSSYLDKCDKRMLGALSAVNAILAQHKPRPLEKTDDISAYKKQISELVDDLHTGEESELQKSLRTALESVKKGKEYYVSGDGIVYLKKA